VTANADEKRDIEIFILIDGKFLQFTSCNRKEETAGYFYLSSCLVQYKYIGQVALMIAQAQIKPRKEMPT